MAAKSQRVAPLPVSPAREALAAAVLAFAPPGQTDEPAGRQQRKSARTRRALLNATVACLARHGYAMTTTQLIAREANLSRGAMLHHYATKRDLIEAVLNHICQKLIENFVGKIGVLSEEQRVEQQAGLELYWQQFLSVDYQAFLELQIAARTDTELRALFEPRVRRFFEVQHAASRLVFPEWGPEWDKLELVVDFCQATMLGLLLNRAVIDPRARRVAVRRLFSAAVYAYRTGQLTLDNHPEATVTALDKSMQWAPSRPEPKQRRSRTSPNPG